jgi:hypothetical protein
MLYLAKHRRTLEDNNNVNFKEKGYETAEYNHLSQTLVNMVINFRVPQGAIIS